MSNSDVLTVSSDEESSSVSAPIGGNEDPNENNASNGVVSVEDDETETDSSDCEIINVDEIRGEGKWRNVQSPIHMLNALLQAGYNDPSQLLGRMFGMSPKSIPPDPSQQWGLLLTLLTEPSPRRRLRHIHTLGNVLELLNACQSIMVVTGAGISVSCGIPDFRSRDGIYARLSKDYPDLSSPQSMFDMAYFSRNPVPFFKFAKEIFPGQFSPSLTHRFVALLETKGKLRRNYTQNIDTLEHAAGISRLIQCHGSFMTATCVTCKHRVQGTEIKESVMAQRIPHCPKCTPSQTGNGDSIPNPDSAPAATTDCSNPCFGVLKPDIVFFGEDLPAEFHDALAEDVKKTDLVLVIGSSLKVRPVAHIPNSIPDNVPQILINREPLSNHDFDVELLGDCDVIVRDLCARLGWDLGSADLTVPEQPRSLAPIDDLVGDAFKPNDCDSAAIETREMLRSIKEASARKISENVDTTISCVPQAPEAKTPNGASPNVNKSIGEYSGAKDQQVIEVVEVDDSDNDEDGADDVLDIAALLPDHSYTYVAPNQYVFPGAEFFISQHELFDRAGRSCSTSNTSSNASSPRPPAHSDHTAVDCTHQSSSTDVLTSALSNGPRALKLSRTVIPDDAQQNTITDDLDATGPETKRVRTDIVQSYPDAH